MKKVLPRWKGEFNWHGEIHILHTRAETEHTAYRNLVWQLTKILKVTSTAVKYHFNGYEDNFKITKVM